MQDDNQLQTLLRMKRYEQPSPDHFEKLLGDFQQRQRQELLKQSVFSIARERLEAFCGGIATEIQTVSHGLLTVRRLATGGAFAAVLAVAATLPMLDFGGNSGTQLAMQEEEPAALSIPSDSAFFSSEAIAASLDDPILPVRHSGLVFDSELSGSPELSAVSQQRVSPHYVVDYAPTGGSGQLSF